MWTEFDGLNLNCDTPVCVFKTGRDVLEYYKMEDTKVWAGFVVLIGMIVLFRVVSSPVTDFARSSRG